VRENGIYRLNGTKISVSNLTLCHMLVVVARTDPDSKGTKGLSVLLVDLDAPGVTRSQPIEMAGRGAGNVGQVFFADVRVPADRLLGGVEGRGLAQIMTSVNSGRLLQAARWLAACETAFAITCDFVRSRNAFGQRLIDFQNTQFRLADIKTEIAVARAFLDRCLIRGYRGTISFDDTAMAKLWISEMETRVMDQCVQLHGAMGVANEAPISKMWTASRVHRIFIGTSEMQRIAIARNL
jgi:acyl-CoA dehydrogenase